VTENRKNTKHILIIKFCVNIKQLPDRKHWSLK
jgi:hypothetical protein